MANNPFLSDAAATAAANAIGALCNGGSINIYVASQPANANTPLTGQTLLASLGMASPAFGAATAGGNMSANAIAAASALATGTAAWFRILASDGVTVVMDGTVGTSGVFDIVLTTTAIVAGTNVAVTSYTYTQTE